MLWKQPSGQNCQPTIAVLRHHRSASQAPKDLQRCAPAHQGPAQWDLHYKLQKTQSLLMMRDDASIYCTSNQRCCSRIQGFNFPQSFPVDLATWENEVLLLLLLAPVLRKPGCLSKQRRSKGIPQHGSRDSALMSLLDYGLWVHLRWGVIV